MITRYIVHCDDNGAYEEGHGSDTWSDVIYRALRAKLGPEGTFHVQEYDAYKAMIAQHVEEL